MKKMANNLMTKTKQLPEREELAELLHEFYLEATKELNPKSYNPNAQKSYMELTSEQRFIDRYIAGKVLSYLEEEGEGANYVDSRTPEERESDDKMGVVLTSASALKEQSWEEKLSKIIISSLISDTKQNVLREVEAGIGADIEGNAEIFNEEQEVQIVGQNYEKARLRALLTHLKEEK